MWLMTLFALILLLSCQLCTSKTIRSDESNSWHLLCEMKHKNDFVYDASVTSFGCRLNCIVLRETKHDVNSYFTETDVYEHNLNDGIFCKRDHVSVLIKQRLYVMRQLRRQFIKTQSRSSFNVLHVYLSLL